MAGGMKKTSREEFNDLLTKYYASLKRDYQAILNPYIFSLLDYLKLHNYKIALASSSSQQLIHYALTTSKSCSIYRWSAYRYYRLFRNKEMRVSNSYFF